MSEDQDDPENFAMSFSVTDPEALNLAAAIARQTGESLAHAVTQALRERYEKLNVGSGKASVEELISIAKQSALHLRKPYSDHGDFLYDDQGLPK